MPVDIGKTLRQALSTLTIEKQRIDRQIVAIETALQATNGRARAQTRNSRGDGRGQNAPSNGRRRMSASARKAVSARMKAYWAKRRRQGGRTQKQSISKRK
jgi:hypothetical protein